MKQQASLVWGLLSDIQKLQEQLTWAAAAMPWSDRLLNQVTASGSHELEPADKIVASIDRVLGQVVQLAVLLGDLQH